MNALLVSLALFGQPNAGLPPLPDLTGATVQPPVPVAAGNAVVVESVQEMKAWLLARLIVDQSFDARKVAEIEKMIDSLNEQQLRVLIAVYKERSGTKDPLPKGQPTAAQQQVLNQAKLDLQQAEAYRDHLKREYDRQILQGHMTQNLFYQNMLSMQRGVYAPYGPAPFAAYGYNPYVYGGYPAAGYGGPAMYGNPYYYGGYGY